MTSILLTEKNIRAINKKLGTNGAITLLKFLHSVDDIFTSLNIPWKCGVALKLYKTFDSQHVYKIYLAQGRTCWKLVYKEVVRGGVCNVSGYRAKLMFLDKEVTYEQSIICKQAIENIAHLTEGIPLPINSYQQSDAKPPDEN